jgi:hypothetical protein
MSTARKMSQMDHEQHLKKRADRVEARAEEYVHRAKRMVLDLFGIEAAKEQSRVTLQLATAMIHLEAAEMLATAQGAIAKTIETKES